LLKSCSEPFAGLIVAPSVSLNCGAKFVTVAFRLIWKMRSVVVDDTCRSVSERLLNTSFALLTLTKASSISHSAFGASSLKHEVKVAQSAATATILEYIFISFMSLKTVQNYEKKGENEALDTLFYIAITLIQSS
jgi:hypothetical protein